MIQLETLPSEIIHLIFQHAAGVSPGTLIALSVTSKFLRGFFLQRRDKLFEPALRSRIRFVTQDPDDSEIYDLALELAKKECMTAWEDVEDSDWEESEELEHEDQKRSETIFKVAIMTVKQITAFARCVHGKSLRHGMSLEATRTDWIHTIYLFANHGHGNAIVEGISDQLDLTLPYRVLGRCIDTVYTQCYFDTGTSPGLGFCPKDANYPFVLFQRFRDALRIGHFNSWRYFLDLSGVPIDKWCLGIEEGEKWTKENRIVFETLGCPNDNFKSSMERFRVLDAYDKESHRRERSMTRRDVKAFMKALNRDLPAK